MIFVTKEGTTIDAKTVGAHPRLTPGYHWRNTEPLGAESVWRETAGTLASIDINTRTLFGYGEDEFMAKQYKH